MTNLQKAIKTETETRRKLWHCLKNLAVVDKEAQKDLENFETLYTIDGQLVPVEHQLHLWRSEFPRLEGKEEKELRTMLEEEGWFIS